MEILLEPTSNKLMVGETVTHWFTLIALSALRRSDNENMLSLMNLILMSILTDLQVTPTKPGRMTKPYSSHYFIANCFNVGNLKMDVKDYTELNNLNVPLEPNRDQVDDLMPTIKEDEVVEEFRAMNDARMVSKFFRYSSDCDQNKKIRIDCAYNLKFSCMIDFAVLEDMDAYRDERMGDAHGKVPLKERLISSFIFTGCRLVAIEDDSTSELEHLQSIVNELDHMVPEICAQYARLDARISRIEARMEKIKAGLYAVLQSIQVNIKAYTVKQFSNQMAKNFLLHARFSYPESIVTDVLDFSSTNIVSLEKIRVGTGKKTVLRRKLNCDRCFGFLFHQYYQFGENTCWRREENSPTKKVKTNFGRVPLFAIEVRGYIVHSKISWRINWISTLFDADLEFD
uniref:Ankyrin repeat-containing domain, PGG domain, Gag-polypeptide of LTR copia-type n=1 Tax=Tanacetum cinerariifolium TaxID=118510 RepID=A0A6L2JJ51_TANCI|nr:ankyrin repeat-containing domain, PGG domain, Gag-polypeptide of LTR copia-type [Tanacetum cinerariifolium]